FSSRRRHTRFSRDWSSDVCSSDLLPVDADPACSDQLLAGAAARHPRLGEGFLQPDAAGNVHVGVALLVRVDGIVVPRIVFVAEDPQPGAGLRRQSPFCAASPAAGAPGAGVVSVPLPPFGLGTLRALPTLSVPLLPAGGSPPVVPGVLVEMCAAAVPVLAASRLFEMAAPTARSAAATAADAVIVWLVHRCRRDLRCRRVGKGRGREVRRDCAILAVPGNSWWCDRESRLTPGPGRLLRSALVVRGYA